MAWLTLLQAIEDQLSQFHRIPPRPSFNNAKGRNRAGDIFARTIVIKPAFVNHREESCKFIHCVTGQIDLNAKIALIGMAAVRP